MRFSRSVLIVLLVLLTALPYSAPVARAQSPQSRVPSLGELLLRHYRDNCRLMQSPDIQSALAQLNSARNVIQDLIVQRDQLQQLPQVCQTAVTALGNSLGDGTNLSNVLERIRSSRDIDTRRRELEELREILATQTLRLREIRPRQLEYERQVARYNAEIADLEAEVTNYLRSQEALDQNRPGSGPAQVPFDEAAERDRILASPGAAPLQSAVSDAQQAVANFMATEYNTSPTARQIRTLDEEITTLTEELTTLRSEEATAPGADPARTERINTINARVREINTTLVTLRQEQERLDARRRELDRILSQARVALNRYVEQELRVAREEQGYNDATAAPVRTAQDRRAREESPEVTRRRERITQLRDQLNDYQRSNAVMINDYKSDLQRHQSNPISYHKSRDGTQW